ncbi:hypothetical protein BKA58DRAFT_420897 [Alternaria rosae]|uniref:uncharacterized protein n=1 Tax=Alternaria rosae TaxID=1187941 RepID=UPI001E8E08EA|nr:uncharacterized protein BKA58DRAFT_420897 [Alternaria rosae]KAH6870330.1 hypothetical protein BKA58DRAFT_420897 [Alternaria rosae]
MSSCQNQMQQSSTGGRPTGATGGGYNKYPCPNWQQAGHPSNYNFVDQKDQLAHPAGAERKHFATSVQMGLMRCSRACSGHAARAFSILVGYYLGSIGGFVESSDDF